MISEAPQLTRYKFSVAEYHAMIAAGVFHEDTRVEFINGEVVAMSPINYRHSGTVKRLNRLFTSALGNRAIVSVQDPIEMEDSEPQPDVALLRPRADTYTRSHPEPADVLLIVEVADTSLEFDRGPKALLYARAGIPELWIANLVATRPEVCRDPGPDGYRSRSIVLPGERLSPLAFPEIAFNVSEILE